MKKQLVFGVIVLLVALLAATPAFAQGGSRGDRVNFGGDVVVQPGETVRDAISFGGNVTISKGAVVQRDALSMGGNVSVDGEVGRNVTSIGGDVNLGDTAVVRGDVTTVGGTTHRAEGAQVGGQIQQGFQPGRGGSSQIRYVSRNPFLSFILGLFQSILAVLVATALAALAVLFVPRHIQTIRSTAEHQPVASPAVGCLTLIIAPFLLVAGVICLVLPGAVLAVLLVLALLVGWVALGLLLGERILAALRVERRGPEYEILAAALGTAIISAVTTFPNIVPFVGGLFTFVVRLVLGAWGLGAVVLTRFGTRPYPPVGYQPSGPPYAAPPIPLSPPPGPPATMGSDQ